MEFAFKKSEQSPADVLSDRVYAAMETGNAGAARVALAEASAELTLEAVPKLRTAILAEYGIRL